MHAARTVQHWRWPVRARSSLSPLLLSCWRRVHSAGRLHRKAIAAEALCRGREAAAAKDAGPDGSHLCRIVTMGSRAPGSVAVALPRRGIAYCFSCRKCCSRLQLLGSVS